MRNMHLKHCHLTKKGLLAIFQKVQQAGVMPFQVDLQDVTWYQQMEIVGGKEQCRNEETKRGLSL